MENPSNGPAAKLPTWSTCGTTPLPSNCRPNWPYNCIPINPCLCSSYAPKIFGVEKTQLLCPKNHTPESSWDKLKQFWTSLDQLNKFEQDWTWLNNFEPFWTWLPWLVCSLITLFDDCWRRRRRRRRRKTAYRPAGKNPFGALFKMTLNWHPGQPRTIF